MKKKIEEYMHAVWNQKQTSAIDDLFHSEAVIHSPLGQKKSPKEMAEVVDKWLKAIPDIQVEFLDTVEENGKVFSHWRAKGTHQKEISGIPPKGNPVEYEGCTIYRFQDGKVVEYWAYIDTWSLESQMRS